MYLCTRKDTPSDVLNLPVFRLYRFRSDIVTLILILRFHFLSYAIELVQVLLPVLLLLLLLVHAITSGIVCAGAGNVCVEKHPTRVLSDFDRYSSSFFCFDLEELYPLLVVFKKAVMIDPIPVAPNTALDIAPAF